MPESLKETLIQVFFCEFYEISKSCFFLLITSDGCFKEVKELNLLVRNNFLQSRFFSVLENWTKTLNLVIRGETWELKISKFFIVIFNYQAADSTRDIYAVIDTKAWTQIQGFVKPSKNLLRKLFTNLLIFHCYSSKNSLHEMCPNTESFLVRMYENTGQT